MPKAGEGMTWDDSLPTRTCDHCGQQCYNYEGGYGGGHVLAHLGDRRSYNLCHPNDETRPDCFRRVTIYQEPMGALAGISPKPAGIEKIQKGER